MCSHAIHKAEKWQHRLSKSDEAQLDATKRRTDIWGP